MVYGKRKKMDGGKFIMQLFRISVAGLFIFSGLIKMNDPVGMAIKLEEYFEVFASDMGSFFEIFVPFSLPIAVIIVVLEVVLGFALLLNWRMVWTTKLLLTLIIFFTMLTFYSAAFNKVTDCGCFGDAIKLTPWQSFYKDITLLIMSGIILINSSVYDPYIKQPFLHIIMGILLVGSVYTSIHAINHLPFVDFRTYKVGGSIPEQMEPSGELMYEYVMTKGGEEYRFMEYPTDKSYAFKEMIILNPEVQPKITDYGVWNDGGEFTEETFKGKKLFVIIYNTERSSKDGFSAMPALVSGLGPDIEVNALTATDGPAFEAFLAEVGLEIPYYYADATVLKTIIRSNPGIFLLQDGVIKGKWHYNDVPSPEEVRLLLN